MSHFSRKTSFLPEKTPLRGKPLAGQQGLEAAARPLAAAARPEGAAARPEPPRRPKNDPGGLWWLPDGALGAPKAQKKTGGLLGPLGPMGPMWGPWGPMWAHAALRDLREAHCTLVMKFGTWNICASPNIADGSFTSQLAEMTSVDS